MAESILHANTWRLLEDPVLGEQDLDTKVLSLLEAEYLRRLARYQRVDHELSQKFGLMFEEFIAQRITKRRDYTWDVERDAMDWETAIGGIKTVTAKLHELKETAHD